MLANNPILFLSKEGRLGWYEEAGVHPLNFLTGSTVQVVSPGHVGRQLTWANVEIDKVLSEFGQSIVVLTARVNRSDHFMTRMDRRGVEDQVAEDSCV